MKKLLSLLLLCVIFVLCLHTQPSVCMAADETIEFLLGNKIFEYNWTENVKHSNIFNINYEINKFARFSGENERKALLKKMVSLDFDNEIIVKYLFPNIDETIYKMEKIINVPQRNASCIIDNSSAEVFKIKKEKIGRSLDKNKLYQMIIDAFKTQSPMKFNLPIANFEPEVNSAYFEKFTHLRSDFSTNISTSSADRKHNIKNALNALNKVEILPNQIFSFNQTVGRRTEKNGYRKAKIIVNEEFVDGVGGGVCQVSTTLYNAALVAGLDIVEANKHSKQVSYITPGFDAMVNFGSSDLKLRNNTSEKITIITNYSSSKARIRIFGESLKNKKYVLKNKISNIIEPLEEIFIDDNGEYKDKVLYEDESFCLKNPQRGMTIESFVESYHGDKLVAVKKLRKDVYKPQNKITVYGTKKRTENCA